MRAVVLLLALGACGRFGFGDSAIDASAGTDADAIVDATPDAPSNAIDVTVADYDMSTSMPVPIAGAKVIVDEGTVRQSLVTDAEGKVRAIVSGHADVHVAYHPPGYTYWAVSTFVDTPPGSTVRVGLPDRDLAQGQLMSFPISSVAGAMEYDTSTVVRCGGEGSSSSSAEVWTFLRPDCFGQTIPVSVRARDATTTFQMQLATVTPGTTTSLPDLWTTVTTHDIAVPVGPGLAFDKASAYTFLSGGFVAITGTRQSVVGTAANLDIFPASVDAITAHYGGTSHEHYVHGPATGNAPSVLDAKWGIAAVPTIAHDDATHTISWTYAADPSGQVGSAIRIEEYYGGDPYIVHHYFLDPAHTSVARPQLPDELAPFYALPTNGSVTSTLYRRGDRTFDQERATADGDIYNALSTDDTNWAVDYQSM